MSLTQFEGSINVIDWDNYAAYIHDYIGTAGCLQQCPFQPDGSWSYKPFETFAKSYLRSSANDGKMLGIVKMVGY